MELEDKIGRLEDIQQLNEATIEYVCNFIDLPAKMWKDSDYETRLEFQNLIMPQGVAFDIKQQGFGTEGISALYRLKLNKKDLSVKEKSLLVTARGIEPRLPG